MKSFLKNALVFTLGAAAGAAACHYADDISDMFGGGDSTPANAPTEAEIEEVGNSVETPAE